MTRIIRAVLAAAATLALLAIALPASASPAHVIPRIPDDRTELARIISEHAGTIDSGNWAGYAATGRIFRDISATYQVPSVNCTTTPNAFAYQWIGLDGLSNSTVEQDGVAGYCQSGTPTYFAWSEMYPAGVVIQFYLDPGDAVTSAVRYSGGTFTLSMTDLTSGQSFSQAGTCAGACDRSSAEVISEGYPFGSVRRDRGLRAGELLGHLASPTGASRRAAHGLQVVADEDRAGRGLGDGCVAGAAVRGRGVRQHLA